MCFFYETHEMNTKWGCLFCPSARMHMSFLTLLSRFLIGEEGVDET
jgi:hypothetical protein